MIKLRFIAESDADRLFPLVYKTNVTDTLVWDGPESLAAYRAALKLREEKTRRREEITWVMVDEDGHSIGSIGLVPDLANRSATIGLWIGLPHQGCGHGCDAVAQITAIGFGDWRFERLEARIYAGNQASRKIFEKNGFHLEGTLRHVAYKRGVFLDEWVMGAIVGDYEQSKR